MTGNRLPGVRDFARTIAVKPYPAGAELGELAQLIDRGPWVPPAEVSFPEQRRGEVGPEELAKRQREGWRAKGGGLIAPLFKALLDRGVEVRTATPATGLVTAPDGAVVGVIVLGNRQPIIDGLYAAGNTSASVLGSSYPGGGSCIGPSVVMGYRAGRHVATQPPGTSDRRPPPGAPERGSERSWITRCGNPPLPIQDLPRRQAAAVHVRLWRSTGERVVIRRDQQVSRNAERQAALPPGRRRAAVATAARLGPRRQRLGELPREPAVLRR